MSDPSRDVWAFSFPSRRYRPDSVIKVGICHIDKDGHCESSDVVIDKPEFGMMPFLCGFPGVDPDSIVVFGLSGDSCLSRAFCMPPLEADKIPDMIEYEASSQIPFDMDEVVWDYATYPTECGRTGVFLSAARLELITPLLRMFEENHKNTLVDIVTPSFVALVNLVRSVIKDYQETVVVLDGRDEEVDFVISSGDQIWHRPIPVSPTDTEDEMLESLSSECQRSLSFCQAVNKEMGPVKKIILVGDRWKERPEKYKSFLRANLDLEVFTYEEIDPDCPATHVQAYALARHADGPVRINLIPKSVIKKRNQQWLLSKLVPVAIVVAVGLITLMYLR